MKRQLALPVLLGSFALALWAPMAMGARGPSSEPRLILSGGRTVRAGQLVDLRWSPADSVSELEILLSLDGGRHYSLCISPQLDPERCNYVWRVPELGGARLRLRIRFNRGGREIEGSPSAPLTAAVNRCDQPEPLGLPLERPAGEDAPRPGGGRGEAPVNGAACGTVDCSSRSAASRHPLSTHDPSKATVRLFSAASPPMTLADRAPRFVPLRA